MVRNASLIVNVWMFRIDLRGLRVEYAEMGGNSPLDRSRSDLGQSQASDRRFPRIPLYAFICDE